MPMARTAAVNRLKPGCGLVLEIGEIAGVCVKGSVVAMLFYP